MAFKDPQYDSWSMRQVSELCRVSHTMVQKAVDARDTVATVASGDTVRPRKEPPTQAEVAENATDTEKSGNVATNDPKNNTRLARNSAEPSTPNLPGAQSAAK